MDDATQRTPRTHRSAVFLFVCQATGIAESSQTLAQLSDEPTDYVVSTIRLLDVQFRDTVDAKLVRDMPQLPEELTLSDCLHFVSQVKHMPIAFLSEDEYALMNRGQQIGFRSAEPR